MSLVVPPLKCQGIKTKLVPTLQTLISDIKGCWVEPFCGSCVVAFNLRPQKARLTDTNQHIIRFYQALQHGEITPAQVTDYLQQAGGQLSRYGADYYYEVRARFNQQPHPLDFLFLNRACFNGVMRFNQKGRFNVPFCHKPQRFAQAYITKITNQVKAVIHLLEGRDWQFEVADFRVSLAQARPEDMVYADPPYAGRHTDYFNHWTTQDESELIHRLKQLPCPFLLSTWQANRFRDNPSLEANWQTPGVQVVAIEHFYHVGAATTHRHPMVEAVVVRRTE